ncbi:hypothetical protein CGMCC3_g1498 [Colletotrichum fructicola]|nr:uncharacterized protein CGMCC3_g1498 [Colletotrichum fructicola]KAE9582700.1 hypothetical protein CGMCC3_g1498 [Colletotrichum fructicola]
MPSRRPHAKSRLGCAQCKARRVKCDETYPKCRNCQRFGKSCSYAWADPYSKAANIADISPPISSPENCIVGKDIPSMVQLTFDALDMKLMHQFSTSTARYLSLIPDAQHIWQHSIPNLAYDQPLLMHALKTCRGVKSTYELSIISNLGYNCSATSYSTLKIPLPSMNLWSCFLPSYAS